MLLKELIYLETKLDKLYLNISMVIYNYMNRCKCTDGNSKGGIWLVGKYFKNVVTKVA